MELDVPQDWRELGDLLDRNWTRIVVVGAADTGKSSLCSYLARRLAGMALLDCDLGQKMVGPPACVTLGSWDDSGLLRLERMHFIGDMHPIGHGPAMVAAVARLSQTPGIQRLLVNTDGLITGPGIPLKRATFDALEPELVIAIERGEELEPILAPLPPGRIRRLRPAPAARRKRAGRRKSSREGGLAQALAGLRRVHLPNAVVEELLRVPAQPEALRLCCVAGEDGEDRALGLIRPDQFASERSAWIAGEGPAVHRIRLGIAVPQSLASALLP